MKIRGILARPFKPPIEYEFDFDNYKDIYPVLDCDCFDIARRKFGGYYYDIFVDDNGLLLYKDPAIFVFDDDMMCGVLVGNCFICNHDEKGDTISLTNEDIVRILNNTRQGVLCCEL